MAGETAKKSSILADDEKRFSVCVRQRHPIVFQVFAWLRGDDCSGIPGDAMISPVCRGSAMHCPEEKSGSIGGELLVKEKKEFMLPARKVHRAGPERRESAWKAGSRRRGRPGF